MVSPLLILAAGLGAAFFLGILRNTSERMALHITVAALGFMSFVALSWTVTLALGQAQAVDIYTAGARPLRSICAWACRRQPLPPLSPSPGFCPPSSCAEI